MTNNWNDLKNASLVLCIGGNPDEAHPAATHHINEARFGSKQAKLVVVDPRKTRWATKADKYLQIRPGTDVAFFLGVLNYYFSNSGTYYTYPHTEKISTRNFWDDTAFKQVQIPNWPIWTDASFFLNNSNYLNATDYRRENVTISGYTVSNVPKRSMSGDNLVLEPGLYSTGGDITVWEALKLRCSSYTKAVVADICGCDADEFEAVAKLICDNSAVASSSFTFGTSKVTTVLYAMGLTQHTKGSQTVRACALMQTVLGNLGRAGGGINAERGIHNVQGVTDMGLLPNSIPGYNTPGLPTATGAASLNKYMDMLFGNPWSFATSGASANPTDTTSGALWQQAGFANMLHWWFRQGSDPYGANCAALQANFDLMATPQTQTVPTGYLSSLGKATGISYRTMLREAGGNLKTLVVWGMNPAQVFANSGRVRQGLKNLDNLIVTDIYLTETADWDRKDNAPTYLLPAAMFPEKAGSSTNSSRWIQWRDQGIKPKGKCKSDLQILLELAYALTTKGAFTPTTGTGYITGYTANTAGYDNYWGTSQYLAGVTTWHPSGGIEETSTWTPSGANGWDGICDKVASNVYKQLCAGANTGAGAVNASNSYNGTLWIYRGAYADGSNGTYTIGSESLADKYKWWNVNLAKSRNYYDVEANPITGTGISDGDSTLGLYGRWCWSWLQHRRVFFNNNAFLGANGVPGDVADIIVAPDQVARLWVHVKGNDPHAASAPYFANKGINYPWVYRQYTTLFGVNASFPRHVEAVETKRTDLDQALSWNPSSPSTDNPNAVNVAGVQVATNGSYTLDATTHTLPLILTTFRDVVHYQGGAMTRNVPHLVELSPEATIEIHQADATARGISNGEYVEVKSARSIYAVPNYELSSEWVGPFKAVVKARSPQQGTVGIPFHWGPKGLATGPTANLLCIDALDANTAMQETKVCLVEIRKKP